MTTITRTQLGKMIESYRRHTEEGDTAIDDVELLTTVLTDGDVELEPTPEEKIAACLAAVAKFDQDLGPSKEWVDQAYKDLLDLVTRTLS